MRRLRVLVVPKWYPWPDRPVFGAFCREHARALATRPAVLVFDEPSSAMDQQTESALLDRLEKDLTGRTFLVITHRTPFLRLVQRVIIVDRGKIVADGPRDQSISQLNRPTLAAI